MVATRPTMTQNDSPLTPSQNTSSGPTVEAHTDQGSMKVKPVTPQEVLLTIHREGQEVDRYRMRKNRWAKPSGVYRLLDQRTGNTELDDEYVKELLKKVKGQVLSRWNWRSYIVTDIESTVAPTYERLKSLTDASEYPSLEDYVTTDELRDTLREYALQAIQEQAYVILDSPTGSGKSYFVSTENWLDRANMTGGKQVIQLSPTKEARDQAAAKSREAGVQSFVLKGRCEACPVAAGEHDDQITVDGIPASKWLAKKCETQGWTFAEAKARLIEVNDQHLDALPCAEGGSKCPAKAQWDAVRDSLEGDPDLDVIHATHQFAFVPTLRYKNNLLFDEQPTFVEIGPGDEDGGQGSDGNGLSDKKVMNAVTAFLRDADAPIDTAQDLVSVAKREAVGLSHPERKEEFSELYDAFHHRPSKEWYLNNPHAHTAAQAFTKTLWGAATSTPNLAGRRADSSTYRPPCLSTHPGDDEVPNQQQVSIVLNESNTITTLRIKPVLESARSVIGFDAYPVEPCWQSNVGDAMTVKALLSDSERRLWRRFERRLCVIQVGDGTYSYTSSEHFKATQIEVAINALYDQYGDRAQTAITASSVEEQVARMLPGDAPDPCTMHFNAVESRNDFKGETIGQVYGCIDPGDDYVLDVLAGLGYEAEPERTTEPCRSCSGNGCNECGGSGQERAPGRGFVGPDAADAQEVLASVRENEVAQSIGRYARETDDPDDWATVFVRTDAVPDTLVDFHGPTVWEYTEKQRAATEFLTEHGEATLKEIAEWISDECEYVDSCTKRNVRHMMRKHVGHGNVSVDEGVGYNGADLYQWEANHAINTAQGTLNFQMEQVDNGDTSAASMDIPLYENSSVTT